MSTEAEREKRLGVEGRSARAGSSPPGVLIVDDSGYTRRRLRRFIVAEGWTQVLEAADGDAALALYSEHQPSLVLIDQIMRGKEGVETGRLLLEKDPDARLVMLTVVSDPELHARALKAGFLHVLRKTDWDALRNVLVEERSTGSS